METKTPYHEPVLLKEVLKWLKVEEKNRKVYLDATVGLGGHSLAILENSDTSFLYGFEWNEDSYELALKRLEKYKERIKLYNQNFIFAKEILQQEKVLVDGILLDLGLSSFLLEGSKRGFSYQKDEPLDMRINLELNLTAKDLLHRSSYEELVTIFKKGEVPKAESLAKKIVEKRKKKNFETTFDLVTLIKELYPSPKRINQILPIVFQSLRIEVNKELENLKKALEDLPEILKPGGRLVVISFHSLEDRLVKEFFKRDGRLKVLTKKPIVPDLTEIKHNPRSRSAKMRVGERI
ncbi:MAG: 16S rRNA (cytosine(1402)-N(4))-methyltransferase RsmH [Thermodesulfobacteriaceae bacterium]|nr:16S rRNA (cytosine(1402)-N(4))-methyltransferase RsmH [Thermodesulfobacteriaceae bacterium]MDW8135335.1 16S rRNA (cytosine(1402)-N(4))-methyltransferase RsmH [Thermodesulfobacterium sp.]